MPLSEPFALNTLLPLFVVGLLGGAHCVSMCGGILGALSMSGAGRFKINLAYNLGRIASYVLAGSIAGALGAGSMVLMSQWHFRLALLVFANLMLVALGFYLLGVKQTLVFMERLGGHIWRRIQPFSQKFLPVTHVSQAFPLGMLWGWLPCGLVYSALATALGAGSFENGGLVMLAFGLGTLPNLLLSGLLLAHFRRFSQKQGVRTLAGGLILAYGIYGLYRAFPLLL